MPELLDDQIQVSIDGKTVWVHALDGSTVGRFSKVFGMDVHSTIAQQLAGAGQCLHCTHEAATKSDWILFCKHILDCYGIAVDQTLVAF